MWNNTASESTGNRAEPPRKRRRPALSCFECRRRKIKCDRNQPCNQCVQSRVPRCSYDTETTVFTNGQWSEAPNAITSAANPGRRAPHAPHPLLPQFPTPASSPRTVTNVESANLLPRPSQDYPDHLEPRPPQIHKGPSHSERPSSQLSSQKPFIGTETSAAQRKSPELQGVLSKNRLYGPSHYVSSFSFWFSLPLEVAGLCEFTAHIKSAISCLIDNHQPLIR